MTKFSTLNDVAKLANTTAGTVSYVLNEKKGRYISSEMRERVLNAAETLHYVKCTDASILKTAKQRKLIGILIPQPTNQFFIEILMGCNTILNQSGYDFIIAYTMDDPQRERDILMQMVQKRVDGILLSPTNKGKENTSLLRKIGIKLVVIDRPLVGVKEYNGIKISNYNCGYIGSEYLIKHNHKQIGFIGWNSQIADLESRERGVFAAMERYGMDQSNFHVLNGEFSSQAGWDLTRELLQLHPETTAIFYGYNVQALGGVKYLKSIGARVPDDISVIINGKPEWAKAGYNDFTCIDMYPKILGENASRILVSLIETDLELPSIHIIQDGILIPGSSVRRLD